MPVQMVQHLEQERVPSMPVAVVLVERLSRGGGEQGEKGESVPKVLVCARA